MKKYTILVTNDDGIQSPGLRAVVKAAMKLGEVTVAAPSNQQTATGRGLTGDKEAKLEQIDYQVDGVDIAAYHCDCSPALVVRHSMLALFSASKPDLLISGINYGENLGTNITCSGTVGAALEAASYGIPAIAISKQTDIESHHNYTEQDWSATEHFLEYFSNMLLKKTMPPDVSALKIDIPQDATPSTPWKVTKLSDIIYYSKVLENPSLDSKISDAKTVINIDTKALDPESDVYVFAVDKCVSVTPLSVDLTSKVNFSELQDILVS